MKKLVSALCTAVLILASIIPCHAAQISVSAVSAILIDAENGTVLYEKDADRRMSIASTTKIMTALVVIENGGLQDTVTVKQSHMTEGSSMYLKVGEKHTVEELLYGLMLASGNDAALALTDTCGGMAPFVARMNQRAASLGMTNTSFENPNGLDGEKHYSTARDMARLAQVAMENPMFQRICSTVSATVGEQTLTNHNRLLRELDGCIGVKTGYTSTAGRTLVSCAERDGHRLIAVTLCDGNDWADHERLYAYGFSTFATGERA
jgi:D-alanyl-D-alanine carboxypeptidase (penicillin-binding protein 5/6)